MQHTPSSSSGANASSDEHQKKSSLTSAADALDDYHFFFEDIVLPPDIFFPGAGLDDDGGDCYNEDDDQAAVTGRRRLQQQQSVATAMAQQGDEERLVMYYHGQMFVYDSVQPQKIENIFQLLNEQEMAPQTVRPQPTHLVKPIAVPHNFDRLAALTRYREKRRNIGFIKKADYSSRREVALRMKRNRGKFVGGIHEQGKTTDLTFCTNCGESSDATPRMRHAPNGSKTFCNACGLMWATARKLRKIRRNPTSEEEA
ncbi:hypothetical protein GUJ93_ZPchr0011g27450 [Zizania palustris]|uniref:Uncharacterized protein n=1 Tax=Zizania palustris TaxID=103762 RepID=A0A8J6BMH5_ZIZPA|nr:hypothetical protein GUJ93_ZPchr0011g27450 [Zizania palustris]